MSTAFPYDPDILAERAHGLTGDALAEHWQRVGGRLNFSDMPVSQALVDSAYASLDYWESREDSTRSSRGGGAVNTAFDVLCKWIGFHGDTVEEHVSRIATYFKSQNIVVAFTAVRQFEYRIPGHRHRVLNQLVELAAARDLPPSPVEMTLGGIAFLQLFLHDPTYATWPQLQRARDECIYGCFHWTVNGQNISGERFAELGQEIASYGVSEA